jgi:hypothetical protein
LLVVNQPHEDPRIPIKVEMSSLAGQAPLNLQSGSAGAPGGKALPYREWAYVIRGCASEFSRRSLEKNLIELARKPEPFRRVLAAKPLIDIVFQFEIDDR